MSAPEIINVRQVVHSFRSAINCEENDNNSEAYSHYLNGLTLVASALREQTHDVNVSLKLVEQKRLLQFAKQSVDRLIFIIEKQEEEEEAIKKKDAAVHDEADPMLPFVWVGQGPAQQAPQGTTPVEPGSPLAIALEENRLLIARYSTRLKVASSKLEKQNLQLELERRVSENLAIAKQRQESWNERRGRLATRCLQQAKIKFNLEEKLTNGTIKEIDFKKQRIYAAALQYAEENIWLKRLEHELMINPADKTLIRETVRRVLQDIRHPLGSLVVDMQNRVVNQLSPLLASVTDVSVESDFETACLRHFHNIAHDIKEDLNLIVSLLKALFDSLNSGENHLIAIEALHQVYFAPVKPQLVLLLRYGTKHTERHLELLFKSEHTEDYSQGSAVVERTVKASIIAQLRHFVSLSSPCDMLDCLVAIMKELASTSAERHNTCEEYIGADDLLPRLVQIVVACGLPSLSAETTFAESFMPSEKALGEEGYSLTVMQSVIACLAPSKDLAAAPITYPSLFDNDLTVE